MNRRDWFAFLSLGLREALARLWGPTFEELMTELHRDRYRDVVKYVVCHPMANGRLGVKSEHPLMEGLTGQGRTWPAAAADLLRQVKERARA